MALIQTGTCTCELYFTIPLKLSFGKETTIELYLGDLVCSAVLIFRKVVKKHTVTQLLYHSSHSVKLT